MLSSKSSLANRWLWRIVVAGVILIPLFFSAAGIDSFRLPKEIIFRLETILVVCICVILVVTKQVNAPKTWKDPGLLLPGLIVVWSLISMLASTNRLLSLSSVLWIFGWAAIFIVTTALAKSHRLEVVYVMLIPAGINALVVLLQEADLWNPFFPGKSLEHMYHSALIGNANDVGTFLVAPTVASFALVFVTRFNRLLHFSVTFLLVLAAVANHTLTALIAIVMGFLATVFVLSKRSAILAAILASILVVATVWLYPPLRFRYDLTRRFIADGYYDGLLSGRLIPNLAASHMLADHPLTGVGPGCFKWEFFPYKLKVTERYRNLVLTGKTVNYGEVHNDHLQILAETGFPGYAIFIAALVAIGAGSFLSRTTSHEQTPEERFSRLASFPLALALALLALAQFPLELASALAVNIYLFALCRAWRPNE
jgi:O-antigen ligase